MASVAERKGGQGGGEKGTTESIVPVLTIQ